MQPPVRRTTTPIISALLLSAVLSASAASTWTGGGTTANLSDAGNWGGTAPTAGATTVLNFAGSVQTSPVNDFPANSAFGAWVLNSGASAFSPSGNAINLAIGITNNSSSLFSIGVPITATAGLWARAISGDITFSSPIALGANNITLTGTGHTLTFANGSGVSGTGTLTVSTGTLELNFGSGNFTNSSKFAVSPNTGITNTVNFRSGSAYFVEQNFFTLAGSPGTAILNVLGGTMNINHAGSGQRWIIGSQGTGIVNVNGGALAIGTTTGTIEVGGDNQYSANNGTGFLTIYPGSTMTVGKNTTYGFELGRNTTGKSGANGTLSLFGGTLATARNVAGADGISTVILSGGTLKALSGASALLTNLTTVLVSTNGAIIDDGGIAISLPQVLQHDYNLSDVDGGLTKQGSSTLTLTKDNTYNGPTVISGGKLVGVVGSSCAYSAVTVNNTAGCILGVSINDNTRQWTCGGLTFAGSNAGLDFNFGAVAPSAFTAALQVNGDVNFTGTPTVTLETTAIPSGPGTYPLISWTGNLSGTPPTSATLPNHVVGTLSVVGNTLQLNVTATATPPMTWVAGTGLWDINTTPNWQDANAQLNQTFWQGDAVVFDDTPTGAGPYTVTLNSAVTAGTTTVNSTKDYIISGTGSIGGGTLTKKGTGTLTLSTSNSYSSTVVQGGTVAVAADNNLGVATGGLTLSGATLHTTASLTSGRAVTFSGSDTLQVDPATALTLTTSQLTLNNANLDVNPNSGGSVFLNGKIVLANASGNVTNTIWSGSVNLTNAQPLVLADGTTAATAVLNLLGGTLNLSQTGGNQHLMLGNMGLGAVNINGGALVVGGGNGTVSVGGDPIWSKNNASGTLNLTSGSMTVNNGILMQLGMNNPTNSGAKGYVNLFGGTLTTSGCIGGGNGNGYVLFSGGTLKAGANLSAWLTNLTSAAVSTNGALIDDGGYAVTISQPLVHDANVTGADGGLTKSGSGSLALAGANTYTGPTTISAGSLLLNGTHVGGGSYSVGNGATLGGNGTLDVSAVNGNVTISTGGKVAPGAAAGAAGTFTLALGSGSLNLSAAAASPGTLVFDLAAPGASDTIILSSGTLNIGNGALKFASFAFNNLSAVPGTYTLIHSTGPITGTLASTGLSGSLGALSGTLSISGNDLVLTTVSAPQSVTLTAPTLAGNKFAFSFQTVSGLNYQVQSATNLTPPIVWTPVGSAMPGTGAAIGVTNTTTSQSTFFRVQIQ